MRLHNMFYIRYHPKGDTDINESDALNKIVDYAYKRIIGYGKLYDDVNDTWKLDKTLIPMIYQKFISNHQQTNENIKGNE